MILINNINAHNYRIDKPFKILKPNISIGTNKGRYKIVKIPMI